MSDAPLDMLDLCLPVIKREPKTTFQDLNAIIEALIKYRRAISQKQFELVAPKMREIIRSIDGEKLTIRTDPALVQDLKELVGDEIKSEKINALSNKSLRSSKHHGPDEYVVVNKVWKLEPSKLTEHQREKMKTRRCDIPALYNDLSLSQDSVSIQEWAPKALVKMTDSIKTDLAVKHHEKCDDEFMETDEKSDSIDESPTSQRAKKIDKISKGSPKRSSQSQNNTERAKIDNEKDLPDEMHPKRRMTRELNRIQIDAKIEEVPYSNLAENRLTRSTVKKIEEDSSERRKTRSDSSKPSDTKDNKKKVTRTSLANSPVPSKSKNKMNAKSTNTESESPNEPTPSKRRSTRQTKTDESDLDETVHKHENIKKTDFIDTLELRVEKLPIEATPKYSETSYIEQEVSRGHEDKKDGQNESTAMAMDVDEQTDNALSKKVQKENSEISDKTTTEKRNRAENPIPDANESKFVNNFTNQTEDKASSRTEDQGENMNDVKAVETNARLSPQVLVETETVHGSVLPNQSHENDIEMESETNEIADTSHMSALVFDDKSFSKSLNGSTIITSPEIDAPRSLEFLNDTLNISPIASNIDNVKKEDVLNSQVKKKLTVENLCPIEPTHDQDNIVNAVNVEVKADVKEEEESKIKNENDSNKTLAISGAANVVESPNIMPSKSLTKPVAMQVQSSTPVQSNHSPVSSKFKAPLMGRGAQLLKMINSNKSPKPASPTLSAMNEHSFIKSASPTINQLETAPMCENTINTPERRPSKDRQSEKLEPSENGNFLTLSGALPSPFESPGISILKRKSSNISMDDSMHSPAPKRKRVSFGFPLSQTKEYIKDEEFTPFYMLPSNDSPCGRANRLKRKMKLIKNQNNSAKVQSSSDTKPSQSADSNATNESSVKSDEEVSVKHIQEYLGMDADAYRAKQEKQIADESASATLANNEESNTNAHELNSNSDDSSTESNDDDPEIEALVQPPPKAKTIAEFSDDTIFSHLLSKYSANEILKKLESVIDAKVLTKRLITIMANDKQVETNVLEELAEKHSESFLEHAITENLCSVICEKLTAKSPNAITEYTTEKINNDDQFASDFLDRVSVAVLRQKLMDIIATSKREQHILLEDFLTALKDFISSAPRISPRSIDTGILPEHIHLWVSKLFNQFKLTPEQYLQLTSIYIQKNPPPELDSFD